MTRERVFGRRMFLYSVGGAALGIPFLSSLLPSKVRAQSAPPTKRFIAIQSYSGQIAREWYPSQVPAGYRLRDAVFPNTSKADGTTYLHERMPNSPRHSWARLSDFAGLGLSNVLGTTLDPYLDKINLLRGIDFMVGMSHNMGGYLGNYSAASSTEAQAIAEVPTIDQVMAYSSQFYPAAPILRSLHLGTGSPNTFSYTNYGIAGGPIEQASAVLNPAQAWDDVFGSFMAPTQEEHPNRSLLNAIYEDYARLSRHQRLSVADKQTLDRHMTFLADIERSLAARTQVACTVPPRPRNIENGYPWRDVSSIADLRDTVSLMIDVAVAAIRCDVTRLVTFNIQKALDDASGAWVASYHDSADVAGDWHQFAHDQASDPVARRNLVAISRWIAASVFRTFIERLDVEESNGRTFLDNSLVVWGNELGYDHYSTDVQTIMAGSAGGALRTGYYADYIDWSQQYANPIPEWGVLSPGIPHNRWLVTMLQAMGLRPQDYERGGAPGYGHGQAISTPYNWPGWDTSQLGSPLPGIVV